MKKVQLITDGACVGNPGPGGWACILRCGEQKKEMYGSEPQTTNNRMELTAAIEKAEVAVGSLDVAFYRDDIGLRPVLPEAVTNIPGDLAGKVVVLVDDVLFTGRTIRAALNALNDFGRARAVQLAVMIDRGHRELPIRPDYVGKNLPTNREEMIDVGDDGVWIGTLEDK